MAGEFAEISDRPPGDAFALTLSASFIKVAAPPKIRQLGEDDQIRVKTELASHNFTNNMSSNDPAETEHRSIAAEAVPDAARLLALVEASRQIASEPELHGVFLQIVNQAAAVLRSDAASLQLLDVDRNQLVFRAASLPQGRGLIGERFDANLGIAGEAIRKRRAIRVGNAPEHASFFPDIDAKTNSRTTSLLAVPLIHRDRVLGVLEVLNPVGRDSFDDGDLCVLEIFAGFASASASQAQAFDTVRRENNALRRTLPKIPVIGSSQSIQGVLKLCRTVASGNTTVVLLGETGTGKEVIAREIHSLSPRSENAFIAVNCAAMQETLLESELFGHEKGAFTGAVAQKLGMFELAAGGTLFLDEVGEMELSLQAKLLRVVQEREFVRVGGTRTVASDVRLIAATHRDLKQQVEEGRFREDLYYRLSVFPIALPPLRDRIEDVPLLVEYLIGQIAPSLGRRPPTVSDEAIACLRRHRWPGNIRELRNTIERSLLLATDRIFPEHLPAEIAGSSMAATSPSAFLPNGSPSLLDENELTIIKEALTAANWNCSAAARRLGVSRDVLRNRMKKFKLQAPLPPL